MKKQFYSTYVAAEPRFIKEIYRPGIGRIAVFEDREIILEKSPAFRRQEYKQYVHERNCSRLIDRIFFKPKIDKKNLLQYVS